MVLTLAIYDSVSKDRLFKEASWPKSPSAFIESGRLCSGRVPFQGHQLTEPPILIASSQVYEPRGSSNTSSFSGWYMEQKELLNEHSCAGMVDQACNPNFHEALARGL